MLTLAQTFRNLIVAGSAVVALAVCGEAHATLLPMNASVGGTLNGADYTGDGDGMSLATTPTLTFSGSASISSLPTNYTPQGGSSAPNTFLGGGNGLTFSSVATSVTTLNLSGLPTGSLVATTINDFLVFEGSGGNYEFDVSGLAVTDRDPSGVLSLEAVGNLVDDSNTYATTAAGLTLTENQTGNTGAVIASYTLGSPPSFTAPAGVPEPASILLLGVGVVSLRAARRRTRCA